MITRVFLTAICFLLVSCDDPLQNLEAQLTADKEAVETAQGFTCIFQVPPEPKFPGGMNGWKNHLKQSLKYPNGVCINGKVIISFVVLASGKLADFSITRGINTAADEAALEVLRKSPDWIPVTLNGKAVDSHMAVMIRFGLND